MAITVPGSGSSATTSVTIPTHAVGDMIVIMARGTVAPTAPAAGGTVPTWTTPTNGSGVNNSVGWRIATTIATATNHTSGTWTSAAQMHVLILRRTGTNTLAVGDSPAQGGANNTQTMIYPAFTLTAGKVSNLVVRYGARGTADTEVRTDGAFAASGVWHTEQPATTPTSAVFSKVVTASEGTFTATPAGVNAAYRCGTLEITETAAAVNWSQPEDEAPTVTDAQSKAITSPQADAIAGVDAKAAAVTSPQADAATVTDAIDPQLTEAAFSPADIAGLQCWLDADAIGGADGDPVTTWQDSHTSNNDATGASGQTLQTNEQNGLPGVSFDGVDDQLTVSGITNNDATRTMFVVARASSAVVNRRVMGWANTAAIAMSATEWTYTQNEALAAVGLGGTPTTTAVITVRFNSASSADAYRGLGSATNFDPSGTYQSGSTALAVGSRNGAQYWPGFVFEALVYDSALADADLDDVRDYLTDKWIGAAAAHEQPVDDSIAGTDAQTKAVAGAKADVAAGTDAISKAPGHSVADAIAGTDAQTRQVTKAQADAIAGTDARAVRVTRPQADTATATDAIARAWAAKLTVADGIGVTDAIDTSAVGANEEQIDDSLAVTDAVTRETETARTQPDTIAGTDASTRRVTRPQADAITGTDARTSSVGHALADPVAGTDAAIRRVGSARTDTIAGTDTRASASAKALADTVAGTDAEARVWAAKLVLADGISIDDDVDTSAAGANEENIDDSATVTDAVTVSLGLRRTIGDSFAGTDALVTQTDYVRQPADALTGTDVLARSWAIFEAQDDALTVTDAVNARIPPSRWLPDSDEDWPADTDEDWEAQTDDRWLVSAESKW